MIKINITPPDFEYDIMSLMQAFYPLEKIIINKNDDTDSLKDNGTVCCYDIQLNVELFDDFAEFKLIKACDGADEQNSEESGVVFSDKVEKTGKIRFENDDRREKKNAIKKTLYEMLSETEKKTLPWGNLTGIRPVKIPTLLLEEGMSEKEVEKTMKETYLISDEKLELGMKIAKKEISILSGLDYKEGYSLYVGIPFCPSICLYCSFSSYPIGLYKGMTDKYLEALIYEIREVSKLMKGRTLNSIYIGGGTPTTLEANQLDMLIKELRASFDTSTISEFTVEAGRPDSITKEKLVALKTNGVDRISINPQTMNDKTLKLIGRNHSVEMIRETFHLAREVGFENINMDIIMGLFGEGEDEVRNTLKEIEKLGPDNLTVHSLAVKRAARLSENMDKYMQIGTENNENFMKMAARYAAAMDMEPYYLYRQKNMTGNLENVGYAKKGKEGLYNILMMGDRQDVIALGAGATTKVLSDRLTAKRADNIKDVKLYIENVDEMVERKRKLL